MRALWIPAFVVALFAAAEVRAQDEVWPVIEKAIKAHGGADKLDKQGAAQTKAKGSIDLLGGIEFTQETTICNGKFKDQMQLQVMGQNVAVTTVYDGKKAWVSANGQNIDLDDKLLEEVKQTIYMMGLTKLSGLKDKKYQLTSIGESQVEGKPAVGVKVASKGFRDVNLYFDKATGLVVKIERQALDSQTMQEVAEERIIQEYQDVEGAKVAKRLLVNRDGKKFMEAEILEVKLIDKVDDSEFAKP